MFEKKIPTKEFKTFRTTTLEEALRDVQHNHLSDNEKSVSAGASTSEERVEITPA